MTEIEISAAHSRLEELVHRVAQGRETIAPGTTPARAPGTATTALPRGGYVRAHRVLHVIEGDHALGIPVTHPGRAA
ncbi:hypothetical protein [Streptomyces diastatochromogenes]|uniref:Uncharacterized protein n=1 Tax=Streptomyces diastatochromogenes TaxID=42236 RepID=A0A233RUD7_STRDA|nr:hypothetical protein [Streptomyces diastatochromogenes]MCZ0988801.1 hypothetical protein [Streptomyces diastatochromogenes]OXY87012.1 hypothetical protein BEK98_44315 [Streptomyces diastatochromogenes]